MTVGIISASRQPLSVILEFCFALGLAYRCIKLTTTCFCQLCWLHQIRCFVGRLHSSARQCILTITTKLQATSVCQVYVTSTIRHGSPHNRPWTARSRPSCPQTPALASGSLYRVQFKLCTMMYSIHARLPR